MANETILIVDADTKSQKVLEVSFKKAGYRVSMTDAPSGARKLLAGTAPDLIISDTTFPSGGDGFEFLADLKSGPSKGIPFIFLTEERSLPQKMKGFELGADDYLTKPIYIKEVTTRVELLLQKRAKESLLEDDVEEMEGNLSDITMIDLLQTIEEELRSGTIHLTTANQAAVIYFREGNILDAVCGKLQGEEAIYRLMLWPEGEFVLRYHDQVRRVDRIEKDSGALLLEGIRRLDKYNELLDKLPDLDSVFEADYPRLTDEINDLPAEVGRIARLFDGMRSIGEICEGSPLDDVTTLKIVSKLVEDEILVDVTPEANHRDRQPSRSNLAAWLDGVRAPGSEGSASGEIGREDTSPKFGSSITNMVGKREPDPIRRTHEQAGPGRSVRTTNPFVSLDDDDDDEFYEIKDPRRRTNVQWDVRPKSDWNIHLDEGGATAQAAIREIEEEERRRREQEARHLTAANKAVTVETADTASTEQRRESRESTLQFAPSIDRKSGSSSDNGMMRQLEEDERIRREEEARRLEAQLASFEPIDGPVSPAIRRKTTELPIQPRIPTMTEVESGPEDLRDTQPDGMTNDGRRGRVNTPLSAPASFVTLEESSANDDLAVPPGLGEVSEADAFEDDADEDDRESRTTLDIRPPADLVPLGAESSSDAELTPDIDPGGLFESLADEETAPGEEDFDVVDIEVLEKLPFIERHAVDNELVRATFDLSARKVISPYEIEGRMPTWERETVELPGTERPGEKKADDAEFFRERVSTDRFEAYHAAQERPSVWAVGILAVLVVVVVVLISVISSTDDADEPTEVAEVTKEKVVNTEPEPVPVVDQPPVIDDPPQFAGLDPASAAEEAEFIGTGVGAEGQELALVMSGSDLLGSTPPTETTDQQLAATQAGDPTPPPDGPDIPPISDVKPPKFEENTVPEVAVPTKVEGAQIREAERLIRRGKFDDALGLLRALSKAAPDNQEVAFLHGSAAFNSNRNGEAVEYLAKAERLGYRKANLYLDLAAAYQLDGKSGRAKWAYEKFLKLQPDGQMAEAVRTILATQF